MTIRTKLLLSLTAVLVFVTCLGLVYNVSLESIRHRLQLLESIDDLGVAISDMRRAEKNYLLYRDRTSEREWIDQVAVTRKAIRDKATELTKLEGEAYYARLTENFASYAALAHGVVSAPNDEAQAERTRTQGKKVFQYARGIIRAERERMEAITRSSHHVFLISLGIILLAGLAGAAIIARDIVAPLSKMERATRSVSEGRYLPIDGIRHEDEIGKLAHAFNHMIQQIEKHQDELVQAGKLASLGTLTSGVAHELNNPINNVSMLAQTYIQLYPSLTDEEKIDFMSEIDGQCERAKEIVVNLLDFSRVRPKTYAFSDIGSVVGESLKLVANQIAVNDIECEVNMPGDLPLVHVNANRIKQVIVNILTNAIKAMPNGGRLEVGGAPSPDGRYVNITIRDTGVGIAPTVLPHIFDPFFTTRDVGQGTGLGLSVSYSIIKRHGGTISVQSEPGAGSAFTVALPVERQEVSDGEQTQDSGRR